MTGIQDTFLLNDGICMPWFGLGVYGAGDDQSVIKSVRWAIEAGYRHIDTAEYYQNEEAVGSAVKECGIKREEIFLATKLWNSHHGFENALKACGEALKRLNTDYLDLYLIHWPGQDKQKLFKTWEALQYLKAQGKIRSAGVSNFHSHHIESLIAATGILPSVNQVEIHPLNTQKPLIAWSKEKGIAVTAWGPIIKGRVDKAPELENIAQKYHKTWAQVVLRWHLQNGVAVIPKSIHKERIIENTYIFDFAIEKEDMLKIDALNQDLRRTPDPDDMALDF